MYGAARDVSRFHVKHLDAGGRIPDEPPSAMARNSRASRAFCAGQPQPVLENDMRVFLTCLIGAVGLVIADFGPPAAAQSLKSVVGTLNAIVNPEDAWRLEDQARRYGRGNDERYWRNYGEGLEQRRERGGPE